MKLRAETTNWFREMWVAVAGGVAEAVLIVMAVPHLFNDWGELGRIVAITAISKLAMYIKKSPWPTPAPQVVMPGPNANVTIEQPGAATEENRKQA